MPFEVRAKRWWTPKRCCSSTTTSPRSRNSTPAWKMAWVPTTRSISPEARPAMVSSRSRPRSRPVSTAMRMPAASASGAMVRACWRTSSSVGAMIAAWAPLSMTEAAASSATTVLPEPTSPWSRRSMRSGLARSASISASASTWLPVSVKGRAARIFSLQAAVADPRRADRLPLAVAEDGERELRGEQLVIGQPRELRAGRLEVDGLRRVVGGVQRGGEGRPLLPRRAAPGRAIRAAPGRSPAPRGWCGSAPCR